jgi:hypothetical protein
VRIITVARKPLVGSVASNVLEHGTGALNIGATRIGTEEVPIRRWDDGMKPFGNGAGHPYTTNVSAGRWPANLVLEHRPECRLVGTRKVKGARWADTDTHKGGDGVVGNFGASGITGRHYTGPDGMDSWACEPGCPVAALDAHSGDLWSGSGGVFRKTPQAKFGNFGSDSIWRYGDRGGASRFFKTVKS